jgi:Ca2+-binding EF-hand superfamily protein
MRPPVAKGHTSANLVGAIERHGMGSAIESTPTVEMKKELAADGVALPNEAQLTTLSERMNEWLEDLRHNEGREHSVSWFNLFKELDEDGDGNVTFDELTDVVRRKLNKGSKHMSESALKALWCALDVDDSNSIQKDEMAAFLKRGAHKLEKPKPALAKEHTSANLVGALERHGMGSAIASTPTKEMRKELEAAGVALPNEAQLTTLSQKMNEWLDHLRHSEGREHAVTWFNLFKGAPPRTSPPEHCARSARPAPPEISQPAWPPCPVDAAL